MLHRVFPILLQDMENFIDKIIWKNNSWSNYLFLNSCFLCCKKLYKYNEINNIFPRDKYIMIKNVKNEQLEIKRLCDEIWKLSLEQGVPITPLSEVKESTWITTLSEHLYDEGMFNIETPNEYKQGDIVMVDTFIDVETNKIFGGDEHRIIVISDSGASNAQNRDRKSVV